MCVRISFVRAKLVKSHQLKFNVPAIFVVRADNYFNLRCLVLLCGVPCEPPYFCIYTNRNIKWSVYCQYGRLNLKRVKECARNVD